MKCSSTCAGLPRAFHSNSSCKIWGTNRVNYAVVRPTRDYSKHFKQRFQPPRNARAGKGRSRTCTGVKRQTTFVYLHLLLINHLRYCWRKLLTHRHCRMQVILGRYLVHWWIVHHLLVRPLLVVQVHVVLWRKH